MISTPAKHLPPNIKEKFETAESQHASAILSKDFPSEFEEILGILTNFKFTKTQICIPGGNMSSIAKSLHRAFTDAGWEEKKFPVVISVDSEERKSETHYVDHYKRSIVVETEWNSKDSVFDRDLKNFRQLHDLGVVSVGIIITRADSLQPIFNRIGYGIGEKYGESTTHMRKLLEEVHAGTVGGCPLMMFGITDKSYEEDELAPEVLAELISEWSKKQEKKARKKKK